MSEASDVQSFSPSGAPFRTSETARASPSATEHRLPRRQLLLRDVTLPTGGLLHHDLESAPSPRSAGCSYTHGAPQLKHRSSSAAYVSKPSRPCRAGMGIPVSGGGGFIRLSPSRTDSNTPRTASGSVSRGALPPRSRLSWLRVAARLADSTNRRLRTLGRDQDL